MSDKRRGIILQTHDRQAHNKQERGSIYFSNHS